MTRWAGEGNDWVQKLTLHKPHKDDVIINETFDQEDLWHTS